MVFDILGPMCEYWFYAWEKEYKNNQDLAVMRQCLCNWSICGSFGL